MSTIGFFDRRMTMMNGKVLWVGGMILALALSAVPTASAVGIRPIQGPQAVTMGVVKKVHRKPHHRRHKHRRHHRKVTSTVLRAPKI